MQAIPAEKVFVATESELIAAHVRSFGGQCIMTSNDCLTGTDRVAEANKKLNFDLVINVQGDEPLIDPADIKIVIEHAISNPNEVINAISKIASVQEFHSKSVPKVAKTLNNELLYMSRCPIPGSKSGGFSFGYKQICIYAFPKAALAIFTSEIKKTPFELEEDIEILRFLEKSITVKLVEVQGNSLAVDTDADIKRVRDIIKGAGIPKD